MNEEIKKFLSSFGDELESKVNRLDNIIGRDHWLSVGNYKESLLRNFLRSILPKRFEISTGFILSKNYQNKLLKSKQIDIIIWDSTNYSAIFRDGEFVIIPPEACKAVIEVKGKLTLSGIETTIKSFDYLSTFLGVEYNNGFNIGRYLFAFDIDKKIEFPVKIVKKIASSYRSIKTISFEDRRELTRKYYVKNNFLFDGIYLLNHGFVLSEFRFSKNDNIYFLFRTFECEDNNTKYIYSVFETDLQKKLGSYSNGNSGLWYLDQPGLLSVKRVLNIKQTQPKSVMIIPEIEKDELYTDIDINTVFTESLK